MEENQEIIDLDQKEQPEELNLEPVIQFPFNNSEIKSPSVFVGLFSHIYFTRLNAITNYTNFVKLILERVGVFDADVPLSHFEPENKRLLSNFLMGLNSSNINLLMFMQLQTTVQSIEANDYLSFKTPSSIKAQVEEVLEAFKLEIQESSFDIKVEFDYFLKEKANQQLVMDWKVFKLSLFWLISSELSGKTSDTPIYVFISSTLLHEEEPD